jgi:diguanylate cyclase (GGDEF)-like protein/PAS domain S-box-containing protein
MASSTPPGRPVDEAARQQALDRYAVVDTPAEADFDHLTALAARLFGMPVALLSLLDHDRQWFKSRRGLDIVQTPRAWAFCEHAIRGDAVMVVPDARLDPRFADNPLVAGEGGVRFYAGAPLRTADGHALGTLCVLDRQPRAFTADDAAALEALAGQAMAQLELRRRQTELTQAQSRLARILKVTSDGWWEWDLVSGERTGSARVWSMLGHGEGPPPDLGRGWKRLVHPEDRRPLWRAFAAAVRSGSEYVAAEIRLRHRAGLWVPVLWRGHLERDAHGRVVRLSGTHTDLREVQRIERERLELQSNFEALFANSLDGVLLARPDGTVLAANAAACTMLGRSEAELRRLGARAVLDLDDPRLARLDAERRRHGRVRGELRMRRADGQCFEVEISTSLYRDRHGQPLTSATFRDITERRQWERRLQQSLALLDNLAQHVPGVLYQFQLHADGRSCFPFASQGLWPIYEVLPEQVRDDATPVFQRLHPDDAQAVSDAIMLSAATLQPWRQEYRVQLPQQGLRWRRGEAQPERLADGSVLWHGFITDITERKQAEAQTHRLAYYDTLTGLPNRQLLLDRVGQALAGAERHGGVAALMFIDLDNFKQINDGRGHSVGDRLLQELARRLSQSLRAEDTVARLGGDEFVVLTGPLAGDGDAGARHARVVADMVRALLARPFEIDGAVYSCTGSIGITLFPKGGDSVDDLLREADIAMYRAKESGRDRIAFFEAAMQAEVEEQLQLEQDLQRAIDTGQIAVHLQPQVDARGRPLGGELLLRWTDPRRGPVSPARFIPLAEETGLILPLGELVLRRACEALARLRAAGSELHLSVNVSPRQFRKDDFVERVRALLCETGAPADGLILEVTEGLLIENWQATLARMQELVALGVRFSIDDFGTGYSSLGYLKKLPLYELKIDKSFVDDAPGDPSDTAIVQSILSVARHLGLHVVAEGVETQEQAAFLVAHGCQGLQGYLYARPMPLADWLRQQLAAPPQLAA